MDIFDACPFFKGVAGGSGDGGLVAPVELQAPPILDIEAVVGGGSTEDSAMNTEVDVIQSRGILEQLVKDLDLASDPEFNVALRPVSPISLSALVERLKVFLGAPTFQDPVVSPEQATLNETGLPVSNSVLSKTLKGSGRSHR